jgi:hypothetical protein
MTFQYVLLTALVIRLALVMGLQGKTAEEVFGKERCRFDGWDVVVWLARAALLYACGAFDKIING